MKQINAKVLDNRKVAPGFYRMRLESAYLAKNAKPGQFLEVRCSDSRGILLRRPLGVHNILKKEVEILYEVIGKGTKALSGKKVDDTVDIIGPLGNGFSVLRSASCVLRNAVLVAGGIGVAPMVALAQELRRSKHEVTVIIGARTKSHILCENEFKALGCRVKVATEDGSKGKKGLATDLLRTTHDAQRTTIYACGPRPMLKAVARISSAMGVPCQVSMEEKMACGVGVCLGCPVKVRTAYSERRTASVQYAQRTTQYEYKMVCKDGPVFDAKEIAW